MKYNKIVLVFLIVVFANGCSKKFDQPVLGQLDESKITNRKGVEALLIGAYALLDGYSGDNFGQTGWWGSAASNWVYGSICGSEAYKGSDLYDQGPDAITPLETFEASATNIYLASKWQAVYAGVQRANDVLRIMRKAKDIKPDDTPYIRAEAVFLRAHYHFEAIKMWKNVPFADETVIYEAGNYRLPNKDPIWDKIENDLKYAVANLPADQGNEIGRANNYAAEALLAKAYLFQKKFADAQPLLLDLIQNGKTAGGKKYDLVNYADNFNPATKNSAESVFAVQMSVNDGSVNLNSPGNGNAGDVLNFPYGTAPGYCCGFFQPSQYLVNHFRTDDNGLPNLDNCNLIDVKNDQGIAASEAFEPDTGYLDPRLDWTVGRRGIPYLDWGIHPGGQTPDGWIRDTANGGPYTPIKNVYYKAQEGLYNDIGFWMKGVTANNVNLIRFADILLWAAEVEVEIGDLNLARDYINRVRERAARTSGWVKNNLGAFAPYAANYHVGQYPVENWTQEYARKAVRYERMLELAMEGHRFFDLVRWEIADAEIKCYVEKEKLIRDYLNNLKFDKGFNEYFPIPQTQIDLSAGADGIPKMKQNPGY